MLATTFSLSNPALWVSTVAGTSVCVIRARVFRSKSGRDPWGMPLWGWVVIGLLFGLIGGILALVATRTSAITAAQSSDRGSENPAVAVWPNPAVAVWPNPATGSTGPTPAGWHPVGGDPLDLMYWDGTGWTARTRWDGERWVDAGRPDEAPAAPVPQSAGAPPPSSKLARFFMK